MAKKKLGGFDFKKVLLDKGERYGFYVAGGLLVLFLALGAITAVKSESAGSIVKDFDTKASSIEQKIVSNTGETPPELPGVIYDSSTVPQIPFVLYATRNELWDVTKNDTARRVNPRILAPTEAQVEFVRGSIGVLDIIEQPDGKRLIGILKDRPAAKQDTGKIRKARRSRQGSNTPRPAPAPAAPTAPPPPPGGFNPGGGGPGGGRGAGGGGPGGGGGMRGGPGGFGGPQTERSTEQEVVYADVNDKAIDSATFAQLIEPHRMVVVTASIPYKRQVEEYQRALRARSAQELTEFPVYAGFSVERLQLSADGSAVERDWAPFDHVGTVLELFNKTLEMEQENPPATMDGAERSLYSRVLPPDEYELLLPRPKLYRGDYAAINLPSVAAALKTLKDLGQTGEVQTNTGQRLQGTNPFDRSETRQGAGGAGGPLGAGPASMGGPGGGGRGGLPNVPGMRFNPGAATGPGAAAGGNAPAVPEDAWVMRFIDITVEPGHSYRYRVSLKAKNPNYHKPAKELAIPTLADKEVLQGEWLELPVRVAPKDAPAGQPQAEVVQVPQEEFVYAAANDDRRSRVTTKMPPSGTWDDTWVQLQRWYDTIVIPEMGQRPEPFGEWLVHDIKAVRGQPIGQQAAVAIPVWVEAQGMFLFRENPRNRPTGPSIRPNERREADPTWRIELAPIPPVVLVDFEGGTGAYVVPTKGLDGKTQFKSINDTAGVEMLLVNADGKLRVARSGHDLADPDRQKREEGYRAWVDKVKQDTLQFKNRGGGAVAPGPVGAP